MTFARGQVYYESEMAGSLLVFLGIGIIIWDSFSLPIENNPKAFYMSYSWDKRLFGDILSIFGSGVILFLERKY